MSPLQQKVHQEIARLAKVTSDLGLVVPNVIEVKFSTRGRNAGWAKSDRFGHKAKITLWFHDGLLEKYGNEFIKNIVGHEYAHAVCFTNYDYPTNHGVEWKLMMKKFKLKPQRTHNYEVSEFKVKRYSNFILTCPKTTYTVSERTLKRHNNMLCRCHGYSLAVVGRETEVTQADIERIRNSVDFSTAKHNNAIFQTTALQAASVQSPSIAQSANRKRRTKLEMAKEIVQRLTNEGESRKMIIKELIEKLEMTPSGASTYYYKVKKEVRQ